MKKRDCLQLLRDDKLKYQDIMRMLNFTKTHVAHATNVPLAQIKFKKGGSPQLKQCFHQWANLINLVAKFFGGDRTKTKLWFTLSNPLLGYISPRNMLLMGRYEKLLRFVTNALSENNP